MFPSFSIGGIFILDVALLGTGGMMPLPNRFLSSMLCRINGRLILTDCGEGTQVTMKMLGWGFKGVDVICITHCHADHISGLPGLLLTIGNTGRTEPIHFVGPAGLERVVRSLCIIAPELTFPMVFHEMTEASAFEFYGIEISTLPLMHWVACYAYSFHLKRRGKFDIERAKALNIPRQLWSVLQKEGRAEYNGQVYTGDMVLGGERPGIKLSYSTDTRPVGGLPNFVGGSDLYICEGMYGEDDKIEKAIDHRHMIFSEAAKIAKAGAVKELWLTHFSPSLTEPESFIQIARDIFPNTQAGRDRMTKTIMFSEENSD